MGLGVSLIVIAVGAILAWAVHPAHPGSVDVNTVGVILLVVGIVGFVLDLMLWSEWGPRYVRRDVVDHRWPYARRRRTVVEDDVPGPPRAP
jgi:hypothetical protein